MNQNQTVDAYLIIDTSSRHASIRIQPHCQNEESDHVVGLVGMIAATAASSYYCFVAPTCGNDLSSDFQDMQ